MPEGQQLPVTFTLWIVALLPLIAILVLLVGLRWKAATAAPVGFFIAVIAAFTIYDASGEVVALQTAKGIWDAIFIIYVIVPALLLYQISKEAGAFETLRRGIESYTPNDLLHILAFGWVFSSFLQGITGFGAPIAVTAPLLVAIGVRPMWAVIIPLIGHAWANTFGTLAVAWEGLGLVANLDNPDRTAFIAAVMLWAGNLLAGFTIAWIYGRMKGVKEALPAVLIISAIHGGGQLLLVTFLPTLSNFLPGAVAVGAILLLARTDWYKEKSDVTDSAVMQEGEQDKKSRQNAETESDGESDAKKKARKAAGGAKSDEQPDMPLWLAFAPYIALVILIAVILLIPVIRSALEGIQLGLSFPRIETGRGVVTEAEQSYGAFSPLTHPGTFLLVSAIVAYALFKMRGYIQGTRIDDIFVDTVKKSIPSAIALFALVPLAKVMEGSGQILELALGIATVASGTVYAFFAPFVGALGSFMTSSNLSSNILFGGLQERTAVALGVGEAALIAAQTAGAAIANSIAPGNVLLGVGAVGESGKTGDIIRRTIWYMLAGVVLAGIIAVLVVTVFSGGGR